MVGVSFDCNLQRNCTCAAAHGVMPPISKAEMRSCIDALGDRRGRGEGSPLSSAWLECACGCLASKKCLLGEASAGAVPTSASNIGFANIFVDFVGLKDLRGGGRDSGFATIAPGSCSASAGAEALGDSGVASFAAAAWSVRAGVDAHSSSADVARSSEPSFSPGGTERQKLRLVKRGFNLSASSGPNCVVKDARMRSSWARMSARRRSAST